MRPVITFLLQHPILQWVLPAIAALTIIVVFVLIFWAVVEFIVNLFENESDTWGWIRTVVFIALIGGGSLVIGQMLFVVIQQEIGK